MAEPGYALIGSVVVGCLLTVFAPRLARVRLFLPVPRSPFGRGAVVVAGEAFAAILILSGLSGLLGRSPLTDLFGFLIGISFVIGVLAVIGGWFAESSYKSDSE